MTRAISLSLLFTTLFSLSNSAHESDAFLDPKAFNSLGLFHPQSDVLIDMATGQMSGGASFTGVAHTQAETPIFVWTFSNFNLPANVSITFTNTGSASRAAAFLSQEDMLISGSIRANGGAGITDHNTTRRQGVGGPGGWNGGAGPGAGSAGGGGFGEFTAGGGGGYGGAGGDGGRGTVTPEEAEFGGGGAAYNPALHERLMGGSGGHTGGYDGLGTWGTGGGGGGALQLGALGSITLSGVVSVNGGAGGHPSSTFGSGGGGGGGSGGGLLVHGADISLSPNASLTARGGNGGQFTATDAGGGGGGGGRIHLAYRNTISTNSSAIISAAGGSGGSGLPGQPGQPGTVVVAQDDFVPFGPIVPEENTFSIEFISRTEAKITWSPASGRLESTPTLVNPEWSPVSTETNEFIVPLEGRTRFFRVNQP